MNYDERFKAIKEYLGNDFNVIKSDRNNNTELSRSII